VGDADRRGALIAEWEDPGIRSADRCVDVRAAAIRGLRSA
jgi:hypothetical protein